MPRQGGKDSFIRIMMPLTCLVVSVLFPDCDCCTCRQMVYTQDNGAPLGNDGHGNGPLRDGKFTTWEVRGLYRAAAGERGDTPAR